MVFLCTHIEYEGKLLVVMTVIFPQEGNKMQKRFPLLSANVNWLNKPIVIAFYFVNIN